MLKELGVKKQYIFLLILRIPFEAARTFVYSWFLKESFTGIEAFDSQRLSLVCIMFFIECTFLFAYNGTVWRFFGKMYAHMQGRLKSVLIESLVAKPIEEIERLSSGDVLVRANTDSEKALAIFAEPFNLVFLLNGLCNFILSSILLIMVNVKLYLLILAFVIPHVALSSFVIAPMQYKIQNLIQIKTAELTELFTSYVSMEDIVYLYDASDFLKNKMIARNLELKKLNVKRAVYTAFGQLILPLFGLSGYLVIMLTGGSMIASGALTYAVLLYVFQLRGGILPASIMMINSYTNIKVNSVSLKRIEQLM